jgi:hypothetical protein
MRVNYNLSQKIESIILIRSDKFKFEMTHSNNEILKEIFEVLKPQITFFDVMEHYDFLGELWIENSIKVENLLFFSSLQN